MKAIYFKYRIRFIYLFPISLSLNLIVPHGVLPVNPSNAAPCLCITSGSCLSSGSGPITNQRHPSIPGPNRYDCGTVSYIKALRNLHPLCKDSAVRPVFGAGKDYGRKLQLQFHTSGFVRCNRIGSPDGSLHHTRRYADVRRTNSAEPLPGHYPRRPKKQIQDNLEVIATQLI